MYEYYTCTEPKQMDHMDVLISLNISFCQLKNMFLLVKKQDCQAVFRANIDYLLTCSMYYLLYCVGQV